MYAIVQAGGRQEKVEVGTFSSSTGWRASREPPSNYRPSSSSMALR